MKHVPITSQKFISKIDMDTEKQKRENHHEMSIAAGCLTGVGAVS
jgi:hypothetical protein